MPCKSDVRSGEVLLAEIITSPAPLSSGEASTAAPEQDVPTTPTICRASLVISSAPRLAAGARTHLVDGLAERDLAAVDIADVLHRQLDGVTQRRTERRRAGVRQHRPNVDGLAGADLDGAKSSGLKFRRVVIFPAPRHKHR